MADEDHADDANHEGTRIVPADERGERFANLIRTARKKVGVSQDDLAQHVGISRSQLIRWEAGRAERPDPLLVRALCLSLGIDPREAAIALGYLTREEAYGEPQVPAGVEEVIELLQDPNVPEEEKAAWIRYLKYLRDNAVHHAGARDLAKKPGSSIERLAVEPKQGAVMRAGRRKPTSTSRIARNPTTSMKVTKSAATGRFVTGSTSSQAARGKVTSGDLTNKPAPKKQVADE
jgi:transcriptional regulator with XRE-family HTH domain